MKYYLYQITNLINGKIYIGVHRTNNLDDGYMGSGKLIKRAQKKYGLNNFKKEILEYFDNEDDMFSRETELVDANFVLREDTYNLTKGGYGNTFEKDILSKNGNDCYRLSKGMYSSEAKKKNKKYLISEKNLEHLLWIRENYSQTSETINKRKKVFKEIKHQQGNKNSQYGTMWITNGKENRKIKKDELVPEGWNKGRKQKF